MFPAADSTPEALETATAQLRTVFLETVTKEGGDPSAVAPLVVPVMFGRSLEVSAAGAGVAWLTFDEICAGAVGAPDFVAVASNFHTVFVSGVPQLSLDRRYVFMRLLAHTAAAAPPAAFMRLIACLHTHQITTKRTTGTVVARLTNVHSASCGAVISLGGSLPWSTSSIIAVGASTARRQSLWRIYSAQKVVPTHRSSTWRWLNSFSLRQRREYQQPHASACLMLPRLSRCITPHSHAKAHISVFHSRVCLTGLLSDSLHD